LIQLVNDPTQCLGIESPVQAGRDVILLPCDVTSSVQIWEWSPSIPRSEIVSKKSGLCLDVAGVDTANCARIEVWHCVDQNNQHWTYSEENHIQTNFRPGCLQTAQ